MKCLHLNFSKKGSFQFMKYVYYSERFIVIDLKVSIVNEIRFDFSRYSKSMKPRKLDINLTA